MRTNIRKSWDETIGDDTAHFSVDESNNRISAIIYKKITDEAGNVVSTQTIQVDKRNDNVDVNLRGISSLTEILPVAENLETIVNGIDIATLNL